MLGVYEHGLKGMFIKFSGIFKDLIFKGLKILNFNFVCILKIKSSES